MQIENFKRILNEKWVGLISIFFLIVFFILTFYLNKKVQDGDLIFLFLNNKPPSLILKNFSAIRTNNNGLIIVSFEATKLNYYDSLRNGELFNPRILLADFPNKKEMELRSMKASYHNDEDNFILKNNVSIKLTEGNNNSFFFQSDEVYIDTKRKEINAIGNVNATIN